MPTRYDKRREFKAILPCFLQIKNNISQFIHYTLDLPFIAAAIDLDHSGIQVGGTYL